jgi:hypothetical protein
MAKAIADFVVISDTYPRSKIWFRTARRTFPHDSGNILQKVRLPNLSGCNLTTVLSRAAVERARLFREVRESVLHDHK